MSAAKNLDPRPEGRSPSILDYLQGVSLFADLRDQHEALQALSNIVLEKKFRAGENIVKEGETGTEMFILVQGQASVYKSTPQGDEYKVAIFDGAKCIAFGESGLIDNDSRTATIRADSECICLELDRHAFEVFSRDFPQWALPVYRRIANAVMARLKKTNNDMMLLYNALVAEIRGR